MFDLRPFQRCLQRTASSVFGALDPYFMTDSIVNKLKGAESRDWMASRPALKKAIISSSLVMPELVDVVTSFVGVWPLIVSYLKETGRKDDGNNLVVRSPSSNFIATISYPCMLNFWCSEKGMDGYFYLDQLARLKFRVFHMLLEICKYISTFHSLSSLSRGVPDNLLKFPRNALVGLPVGSTFSFCWIWIIVAHCRWIWRHCHGYDVCFVSVANNFVHYQSVADYGYYAFGEFRLLSSSEDQTEQRLVEQWVEYMAPNHSKFAATEKDRFLANFLGTRLLTVLEKVGSSFLKKEFKRDCRKFLEGFSNCVLSTVAARSVISQGLSCFCPPILAGGDDLAPMQLFDMLLDGLLEKGWARGAEMEACKSEYQSFMREQRQLERSSTRSRPDVGNVQTFCSSQAGVRVRRHLYKVCIVCSNGGFNIAATSSFFMFCFRFSN